MLKHSRRNVDVILYAYRVVYYVRLYLDWKKKLTNEVRFKQFVFKYPLFPDTK